LFLEKTTLGPPRQMRNGKWRDYWVHNFYEVNLVKEKEFDVDRFEVINAHSRLLAGEFPHVKIGQFNYRIIEDDFLDVHTVIESVDGFQYVCIHNIDGTMYMSRRIYGPPDNYLVREVL